jgi:hypothetical protein
MQTKLVLAMPTVPYYAVRPPVSGGWTHPATWADFVCQAFAVKIKLLLPGSANGQWRHEVAPMRRK